MTPIFAFHIPAFILAIALMILILVTNWAGFRYRRGEVKKGKLDEAEGVGPVEGSLFGLMALILAFTFSMAYSKFELRREVIIEEANDIGTVVLRCDLYPDSIRNALRDDLKNYVEARIRYYEVGVDERKIKAAITEAESYSARIWNRVAIHAHNLDLRVASGQMVPATNAMIDIVSTRDSGRLAKVPPIILGVLFLLIVTTSFLLGYDSKKRDRTLVVGFAMITALTVYLILELDRPRSGIINLNAAEQKMVDLRSMLIKN